MKKKKHKKKQLPQFKATRNGFVRDGKAVVVVRRRTTDLASIKEGLLL